MTWPPCGQVSGKASMRCKRSSVVQGGVSQGPAYRSSSARGAGEREWAFVCLVMENASPLGPIKVHAGHDDPARHTGADGSRRKASPVRPVPRLHLALADGALLAQLGAPPSLAGLLEMSALA